MKKVSIILVEWNGYRLHRKKKLGENIIKCGIKRILDKFNTVNAGVDFNLFLIVNCSNDEQKSKGYFGHSLMRKFWGTTNKTT